MRLMLPARRSLALSLIALLAALAVACGVAKDAPPPTAVATVTAVPASPTPSGPPPTPTPDLTALARDGGIAYIEEAYNRLLDEYIDPIEPRSILSAAWAVMRRESAATGVALPAEPAFVGDRVAAFGAFRDAYVPAAATASDPVKLRYSAIQGMTEVLNDCHTFFLSPVASNTVIDARAGLGTVGIGVELAGVPPLVTEVIPGSPAQKAGILVGDRVVAVDGTDTSTRGPAGALELINGAEGTSVRLALRRAGEAAPVEVTAERARVTPPNVDAKMLDGGIGYVRIRHFIDGGIVEPLREELEGFAMQGARAWVVDIRGNPGGRLDPEAISLFVKDGVIVRNRDRNGTLQEDRANGNALPAVPPVVLLTNNRTGSVSEMFAAALQEYGVAYVIGDTTNGCVGYTDLRKFADGSSLAVTTHLHLGPVTGKQLNGIGVVPDLAVSRTSDDIAAGRDPQLAAAIAHLQ